MSEDIAGGSDMSAGGTFFSRNTEALPVGPSCQVLAKKRERKSKTWEGVQNKLVYQ